MGRIGLQEIIPIAILILILFGARKIPDLMKSLGSGIRLFKRELNNESESEEKSKDVPAEKKEKN